MYSAVLLIHSWLRWVALVAGIAAVLALARGQRDTARGERWGLFFMITLDLQLLLGVLLYFVLSPFTREALADFGAAMENAPLRFFAVEHVVLMLVAIVLVHVGRVLARKATSVDVKRRRMLICFGIALLLILAAIPWPGMAAGRPLFRV
jgi:hypothetical protein